MVKILLVSDFIFIHLIHHYYLARLISLGDRRVKRFFGHDALKGYLFLYICLYRNNRPDKDRNIYRMYFPFQVHF